MVIEFEGKLKRWGRSFGVIIPMEQIIESKLSENDKVEVKVFKKKNVLKETFGTIKLKRSTQEILDESDREAWDE